MWTVGFGILFFSPCLVETVARSPDPVVCAAGHWSLSWMSGSTLCYWPPLWTGLTTRVKNKVTVRHLGDYPSYFHRRLCLITGYTTEGVNPVICDVWDIVSLFMRKSFHLLIKPGLLVATMFVSDAFVLGADLLQDFVEVLLGCCINLHIDCASKLRAQCCQLLNNKGRYKSALRTTCTDSNSCDEVDPCCHKW